MITENMVNNYRKMKNGYCRSGHWYPNQPACLSHLLSLNLVVEKHALHTLHIIRLLLFIPLTKLYMHQSHCMVCGYPSKRITL